MNLDNQVVWITGASSGIGEALAYACIDAGARVILSARRASELERVKAATSRPDRVYVFPLDLTDTDSLSTVAANVVNITGRIDILINNGGISQRSLAMDTPLKVDRRIMETNFFGQVALTKAVIPYMLRQKSGHLVAISSLVGKFGFPLRSAYAASKHALHGFFETLYFELAPKGIAVTLVNPGRIRTEISLNALTASGQAHGEMDPGQDKGLSAEACAKAILQGIYRKKPEINVGNAEIVMVYLKRYAPWLFRIIARRAEAK